MNTIQHNDSYSQFMQVINSARMRNSGLKNTAAATQSPAARPVAFTLQAPVQSMRKADEAVSVATAPKTSGKVLGGFFDAYA